MKVGIQRLALVTPAEKVQEELATFADDHDEDAVGAYGGVSDEVSEAVEVIGDEVLNRDVEELGPKKTARELKTLEVPSWMKPTGNRRFSLNSIVSYSSLKGLNLGLNQRRV